MAEEAQVEHTLTIDARPETVWRFWTDPQRMVQWWGVTAELDPTPGGRCRVVMAGGPVMRGEFVELVAYQRIVFRFGWEAPGGLPDIPPASSRVEVTLTPDGERTVLRLRHTGLALGRVDLHRQGWALHLTRLAQASATATSRVAGATPAGPAGGRPAGIFPALTPEAMNAVSTGGLPGYLGVEIVEVDGPRLRARLDIASHHGAPNGFLHAATIVALADTACGYGCVANLPEGATGFTTVELKTNFVATVNQGALRCDAELVHGGRTTQLWDARVTSEDDGRLLALFRCTQLVLRPR